MAIIKNNGSTKIDQSSTKDRPKIDQKDRPKSRIFYF